MSMVQGMDANPNSTTYQVMNTGPIPKASVPPVLKMDMENPVFRPPYNGTMPVTAGWNMDDPMDPTAKSSTSRK